MYKCLVQGDDDFVGLIAYSLYKKRKTGLAEQHRADNCTEDEIKTKINEYHDMVVTGQDEILRFRSDAKRLLEDMLSKYAQEIKQEAEKKRTELITSHKKELEKSKKQLVDSLARTAIDAKQNNLNWLKRLGLWLFSGVPSAAATILLTVMVLGGLAIFAEPGEKGKFASSVVNKAAGEDLVKPASK